jgi:hypothetical protein
LGEFNENGKDISKIHKTLFSFQQFIQLLSYSEPHHYFIINWIIRYLPEIDRPNAIRSLLRVLVSESHLIKDQTLPLMAHILPTDPRFQTTYNTGIYSPDLAHFSLIYHLFLTKNVTLLPYKYDLVQYVHNAGVDINAPCIGYHNPTLTAGLIQSPVSLSTPPAKNNRRYYFQDDPANYPSDAKLQHYEQQGLSLFHLILLEAGEKFVKSRATGLSSDEQTHWREVLTYILTNSNVDISATVSTVHTITVLSSGLDIKSNFAKDSETLVEILDGEDKRDGIDKWDLNLSPPGPKNILHLLILNSSKLPPSLSAQPPRPQEPRQFIVGGGEGLDGARDELEWSGEELARQQARFQLQLFDQFQANLSLYNEQIESNQIEIMVHLCNQDNIFAELLNTVVSAFIAQMFPSLDSQMGNNQDYIQSPQSQQVLSPNPHEDNFCDGNKMGE